MCGGEGGREGGRFTAAPHVGWKTLVPWFSGPTFLPCSPVQIPTPEQATALTEDLRSRSSIPQYVYKMLDAIPEGCHPMTQLAILVLALQVTVT